MADIHHALLERLPEQPARAAALDAFEQSLTFASAHPTHLWRLTRPRNLQLVRLNVGLMYVLQVSPREFALTVVDSAESRAVGSELGLEVLQHFRSPEGLLAFKGSIEKLRAAYARLRALHEEAIRRAARFRTRVTRAGHDPALLDALGALGVRLPTARDEDVPASPGAPDTFWVVRGRDKDTAWAEDLELGAKSRWFTKRSTLGMSPGDGVIFWRLDPGQEVVGLGEVVHAEGADAEGMFHVWLRSLSGPLTHRLGVDTLRSTPGLEDAGFLKLGPTGTVLSLRASEAEAVYRLVAASEPQAAERIHWWPVNHRPELASEPDPLEAAFQALSSEDTRHEVERSIKVRQGQGPFRDALMQAYDGRCAVTGCTVERALAAAHIVPMRGAHSNDVRNGLLLRADIHLLFDTGLLWVEPEGLRVRIAPRLRTTEYVSLDGIALKVPRSPAHAPHPEALRRHLALVEESAEATHSDKP
jgi:hypothetical protein